MLIRLHLRLDCTAVEQRVCTQVLGANVQVSLLSLLHYDSSVDATVVYQVFFIMDVVQVSLRCKRASLLGL